MKINSIHRWLLLAGICGLIGLPGCAQVSTNKPSTLNPAFDQKLQTLLSFSVPLISVHELQLRQPSVVLLDVREREEFDVSHLPGATYLGYKNLNEQTIQQLPKDTTIVLYCSVGYRSEKIGELLQKRGYQNVYNLYGSIFEWANNGYPLVNAAGQSTKEVHTYNRKWSKWVDDVKAKKRW